MTESANCIETAVQSYIERLHRSSHHVELVDTVPAQDHGPPARLSAALDQLGVTDIDAADAVAWHR